MGTLKMKTYTYTCKYCQAKHQVAAETKHAANLVVLDNGWRNYGCKGWMCPQCVRDYDLSFRFILANRYLGVANEHLYELADKSLRSMHGGA